MVGAEMKKLRGTYAVRSTRKPALLPVRRYAAKKAPRVPELRLTVQPVPRQARHALQVTRSPVVLELGELDERLEPFPTCLPAHRSQRKRARRNASPSSGIKITGEHRQQFLNQRQSELPESTWCMIQDMIANAKSLGDITRITLTFFKEHESVQGEASSELSREFPIVIPASEVYNMLGIGVIKRARGDEASGTKGGSFLYFGKEAAIQHIAKIWQRATCAVTKLHERRIGAPSAEEIDIALLKMCEDQAEVERWPCLTTTTRAFLTFLLQQDIDQAAALPGISSRLVEAKRNRDPNFANESAYADVNRRVYDVVSVLTSCNLVLVSVAPDASDDRDDSLDKTSSKKHVRFNYTVFDDSSSLKIADVSARQLSSHLEREKLHAAAVSKRSDKLLTPKKRRVSKYREPPAKSSLTFVDAGSLSEDGAALPPKTDDWEAPADDALDVRDGSGVPLRIDLSSIPSFNDAGTFERRMETPPRKPTKSVREELQLDSYCPLIELEPRESDDWWGDLLQELLFQDALPSQDLLDWDEIMLACEVTDEGGEAWGQGTLTHQVQSLKLAHIEDFDMTCYEELDDESSSDTFVCL